MEVVLSSAITAIAMLITSYISYRISISSKKLDIEKFKIESKNSNQRLEMEEKINTYSLFLGSASKAFYLKNKENMENYLISYRKFSLLCPQNANSISREIHADVINSNFGTKPEKAEFENKLNSLVKILQADIQQKCDISQ